MNIDKIIEEVLASVKGSEKLLDAAGLTATAKLIIVSAYMIGRREERKPMGKAVTMDDIEAIERFKKDETE